MFLGAGAAIWAAGIQLSDQTDVLTMRLGLGSALGGAQMPATLITARLTPAPVLILVVWVLGLVLLQRAGRSLPWHGLGQPPDGQQQPRGYRTAMTEQQATAEGTSTARAAVNFGFAAAVTLIAGVVLERTGDVIADHIGLSGVLFGATVLAAATSLPELST